MKTRPVSRRFFTVSSFVFLLTIQIAHAAAVMAEDFELHDFRRIALSEDYFSEGANFGDFNNDGQMDIVSGPYWFQGPEFKTKHEIYQPEAQDRNRYADNFFSWVYDFNNDGWNDLFVVGFPGTPAFVYVNPGKQKSDAEAKAANHWAKKQVFDWVSNESPQFTNIVGDATPELVCTRDGYWGYATIDKSDGLSAWTFHRVSDQVATPQFGHGLGVGDIDGDQQLDLITKDGWFQQPASLDGDPKWNFHDYQFTGPGGAEMYAYDVDGDGDNDVVTSLEAHAFGLAWFEQVEKDGAPHFVKHLIMGSRPAENQFGLVFSELHTVNLVDVDGDGLKDIVTGKTYWSHHRQGPMWDAGAVVYWFKLVRTGESNPQGDVTHKDDDRSSVQWLPFKADGDAGVGRQVIVGDINGDKLPDIVVGGMQGASVLLHSKRSATKAEWQSALPQPPQELKAGLTPEEAAANMSTQSGFQVTLAAAEPLVHQPIAFTLDHRGRIWIAEAYTYPNRAPEGEGKDKIIILEDTNQDGRFETRKVFTEGLNLVSGLEVGFGGVWVGAAPYFMFIPDADGDDQPDGPPQVLLDGFGYQDTHEVLNSFIWGPDGWLYGCHGVFTHAQVGKPGAADAERTPMNAAVWRYHPTRQEFEVFASGTSNPWGVDFNDRGHPFITACVIPHLWHIIQGGRYQRQGGQHFDPHTYDDIKTIADHAHFVGNIQDHAWWGHEPQAPHDTLAAGGGHAHCGAMIYLGDNFPETHRDQIFMNNIHGNRVNSDLLERMGSGYVGHHGRDLIVANDRWYRGINLKYGPNGSVYFIDWYDPNACHRTNPEIWDRTNGRVFNVAYGSAEQVSVDLSKHSDAELVALHLHRNDWYVRMARRLLQERAFSGKLDAKAVSELEKIVASNEDVTRQLRAMWTLHAMGKLSETLLMQLRQSPSEYVRGWAIQLELEDKELSEAAAQQFAVLAVEDSSPLVRLYLASALQRMPVDRRWPIAVALVKHAEDTEDHNLPLMYWYGIEPLVPNNPARAMQLARESMVPLITRYIVRRAASDNKTREHVVTALTAGDASSPEAVASTELMLGEMLSAFEGRVGIPMPDSWKTAYDTLAKSPSATIRDRADQIAILFGDKRIFPRMRQLLVDADADMERRQQALDILVRGRDADAVPSFQAVVTNPDLSGAAIRALAAYDDPQTPEVILSQYARLSETQRRDAINTLVSRPQYAVKLLDAMAKQTVPRTDLHAFNVRQLLAFKNEALNERIQAEWGEIRETSSNMRAEIERYKATLTAEILAKADTGNGRRIFSTTCATCHTLFGEGEKVGPDITGSNRANLDYILENIVDPSAVLGKDYRMSLLDLVDGRVVSGLVQKETDSALTVRTFNDTIVIAKADIEERSLSELSIMPERLLDVLGPEGTRDLIAYLASPTQVALKGPRAPIDPKTKKVPGALEGESLKIIGKTAGSAASQSMAGFAADRWSGDDHLWWTGAKPDEQLDLEFTVSKAGAYRLEIVMTRARDYGIIQLLIDGAEIGQPVDLYNDPDVITTGVIDFPLGKLASGKHKLSAKIIGANPQAVKAYMFGLDYLRLLPTDAKSTIRDSGSNSLVSTVLPIPENRRRVEFCRWVRRELMQSHPMASRLDLWPIFAESSFYRLN